MEDAPNNAAASVAVAGLGRRLADITPGGFALGGFVLSDLALGGGAGVGAALGDRRLGGVPLCFFMANALDVEFRREEEEDDAHARDRDGHVAGARARHPEE